MTGMWSSTCVRLVSLSLWGMGGIMLGLLLVPNFTGVTAKFEGAALQKVVGWTTTYWLCPLSIMIGVIINERPNRARKEQSHISKTSAFIIWVVLAVQVVLLLAVVIRALDQTQPEQRVDDFAQSTVWLGGVHCVVALLLSKFFPSSEHRHSSGPQPTETGAPSSTS